MSKSKSVAKAPKSGKGDVLSKVKDAAVAKSGNNVKSKSKEVAKQAATKEGKKDKKKKVVKEPTPEPSESEESDSSESESSASEAEQKLTKPVANGKTNGAKKADVSSDESESESDSADELPKANGAAKKIEVVKAKKDAAPHESDSADSASEQDSEDSSDDSSEDEKPVNKATPKAADLKKVETKEDSDEESDSSKEDEEEEELKTKTSKRKAETEVEQATKKTKTDPVDTSRGPNLFVGNLSWNVDDAWLREVFEEHGELSGVRLMTDRSTGRSKGYGYVEFVNAEDAANAHAAKQGFDLDGRSINVDFANARPDNSQKNENRRQSYGDQRSEPSDTLFVGNLAFGVGQETVTEAFQAHGTILGIRLPTDRETGQAKGFGYVTFASIDEAKGAIEAMDGAYIEGRPVRLDFSQPRPQNSESSGRGRGGFGGGFGGRGGGGGRGGRGGRGGSFGGGRGGRGGSRGGTTNRGGFGDFSGKKTSFD
uniref:RRM domain-containing protein n=1 Tax=Araucaria cunninghamii TaxID=56994 RepID=A0A0D6R517_ARACU